MTTTEMTIAASQVDEINRLRAIERRAKDLARGGDDSLTPQQARNVGIARYILTGQKH